MISLVGPSLFDAKLLTLPSTGSLLRTSGVAVQIGSIGAVDADGAKRLTM